MPLWKRNLFVCLFGCFTTAAGLSLVLPFLPLYVQELGMSSQADIVRWSGYAFGATFLTAAIVSPIWGRMADIVGRKPMLLRAGLGMAIVTASTGLVHNVYELVALRLVMGAVAGFVTAAVIMIATQTPRAYAGWALGMLSTGAVGGNLIGPLIGGWLAETIGLRHTFFLAGAFLLVSFLVTLIWVKEDFVRVETKPPSMATVWRSIASPRTVIAMFVAAFMVQFANFSIEPIVTVYIAQLAGTMAHVAVISGLVVSASAFAAMLAAPRLGRLGDRIGSERVLVGCLFATGLTLIPQAFVKTPWELMGMRFLMGLALAGLLPAVNTVLKRSVPEAVAGRIFGYSQSWQYLGEIAGPVFGGEFAAHFGLRMVFFATAALMFVNGGWTALRGGTQMQQSGNGPVPS